MKAKVSLTIDDALLSFFDAQPGATRSQKIEQALERYRRAWEERKLREELSANTVGDDDRAEDEAWRTVMQEAMWRESVGETSGPSRLRGSRSRGRRS